MNKIVISPSTQFLRVCVVLTFILRAFLLYPHFRFDSISTFIWGTALVIFGFMAAYTSFMRMEAEDHPDFSKKEFNNKFIASLSNLFLLLAAILAIGSVFSPFLTSVVAIVPILYIFRLTWYWYIYLTTHFVRTVYIYESIINNSFSGYALASFTTDYFLDKSGGFSPTFSNARVFYGPFAFMRALIFALSQGYNVQKAPINLIYRR